MQLGMRKMCYVTLVMLEAGLVYARVYQAETGRKELDRRDNNVQRPKGINELPTWGQSNHLPASLMLSVGWWEKRLKSVVDILERFPSPKMRKFNQFSRHWVAIKILD